MSWRTLVVTGPAKLDYKMDYLVVRKKEETNKIHLSEINVLLVDSTAISLTTKLMSELINSKIKVIFCNEKHNPHFELSAYYGSHDTSLKIREQIKWNKNIKKAVWTEIVKDKIKKQSEHLFDMDLKDASLLLEKYNEEVILGDETNREGHAAKVYFNALFGKSFTREEDNVINSALNYGYSLVLSSFNKHIVSSGYLTQLGVFHDNMFNQFNLSSDLMEPFRVIIDRKVISMNLQKFDTEEKREIVDVLNLRIEIDGKIQTLTNAIAIYCRSVFRAIEENDVSLIKKYRHEL